MNDLLQKGLFWVRVAVGALVCLIAIHIFDRVGDLYWSFKSSGFSGYGSDSPVSDEVWKAAMAILQALAAIGTATMAIVWALIKDRIKKWSHVNETPVVPLPAPKVDEELRAKLLERVRKLFKK